MSSPVDWRYSAHRVFRTKWVALYWCTVWYPGYQVSKGDRGVRVDLLLVPGFMFSVGRQSDFGAP